MKSAAHVTNDGSGLDVYESSGVSAVGILLVIYGAFSLILRLILGRPEPPPPEAAVTRVPLCVLNVVY